MWRARQLVCVHACARANTHVRGRASLVRGRVSMCAQVRGGVASSLPRRASSCCASVGARRAGPVCRTLARLPRLAPHSSACCAAAACQVAAALGRPYVSPVGVLEPDQPDLQDAAQYAFGHDAPDGDP